MLRLTLFICALFIFSSLYSNNENCGETEPVDVSQGLIFNYKFNNNLVDSSPNGLNASSVGTGFITDRFGDTNNAVSFQLGDFIQLPNNNVIEVQYPFSFSFWGYFEFNDFSKTSILNTNFTEDNYHGIFLLRRSDGTIACIVGNGDPSQGTGSGNRNNINSVTSTPLNEWTHIVVNVYGPADGEYYINGCWSDFDILDQEIGI